MLSLLLGLSIRGLLATMVACLLDGMMGKRIPPKWRRVWWLIVTIAWICPWRLPVFRSVPEFAIPDLSRAVRHMTDPLVVQRNDAVGSVIGVFREPQWQVILGYIWVVGFAMAFALLCIRTLKTFQQWKRVRLVTDSALLNVLEDCKEAIAVSAPIGLVLSPILSTPALLGWLRPRILLPRRMLDLVTRGQLRGILLHELAHFNSLDIPCHWLFSLAQAVHWYNPVMIGVTRRWRHACELTADAKALDALPPEDRANYGEALLTLLRLDNPGTVPRGALALGESLTEIKSRVAIVADPPVYRWTMQSWAAVAALILVSIVLVPSRTWPAVLDDPATAKRISLGVAQHYLSLLDQNQNRTSWNLVAFYARKVVTVDNYVEMLEKERGLTGSFRSRKWLSTQIQTEHLQPDGSILRGEYAIISFDSSFEKLPEIRERVQVGRDVNGEWRILSYLLMPR